MQATFRFRTLVASFRRWRDLADLNAALGATHNVPDSRSSAAISSDGLSTARSEEEFSEIWISLPARWRLDLTVADGRVVREVVVGKKWLIENPWNGITRGEGEGDHGQMATLLAHPPLVALWNPDRYFFPSLRVEPLEHVELLGRPCLFLRGRPIAATAFADDLLWSAADQYEIFLDVDRRTVHKLIALHDGVPFAIEELLSIEFDSLIEDSVFAT